MDKNILVDSYILEGKTLIENLDRAGFPVYSAVWILDMASETWKLLIATPKIDDVGPHETYRQISEQMTGLNEVLLKDLVAVSPNNDLISLLRSVISTERNAIIGTRFTGNTINNFLIPDAYIYRLS